MKIIGVTGGIASGKSLISDWFKKAQIEVIDADHVYKRLVETNQALLDDIRTHFNLSLHDHHFNFRALGRIVFNDKEKLKLLNKITHPYVKEEINRLIKMNLEAGEKHLVLDVPLLFEANMEDYCDSVICVYVDRETQIERLMQRGHLDHQTAIARIDSQMSLEEKKERSDFVIDNSLTKDYTYQQFRQILAKINQR